MVTIDKDKILESVLNEIKGEFKDEVVGKYEDLAKQVDVETITTGSIAVDSILGGGFAKGRMISIVGMSSSGKTTLALTAIAELQKADPSCKVLYIDSEAALDPYYAASLGVDMNKIYLVQPSCGEVGYAIAEKFIRSGVIDMVVIDSIAAMLPRVMIDQEYDKDTPIGAMARLVAKSIPRINRLAAQFKTTVITINQYKKAVRIDRYDVGNGIDGTMYAPGGNTIHFYMSQILEVRKVGTITEKTDIVGSVTRVNVRKNKISAPFRTAEFIITYGRGLNRTQEIISLATKYGFLTQKGAWTNFNVGSKVKKNGIVATGKYLESPEGAEDLKLLKKLIKEKLDESSRNWDFNNYNHNDTIANNHPESETSDEIETEDDVISEGDDLSYGDSPA